VRRGRLGVRGSSGTKQASAAPSQLWRSAGWICTGNRISSRDKALSFVRLRVYLAYVTVEVKELNDSMKPFCHSRFEHTLLRSLGAEDRRRYGLLSAARAVPDPVLVRKDSPARQLVVVVVDPTTAAACVSSDQQGFLLDCDSSTSHSRTRCVGRTRSG
jgi:hypothetical protein